MMKNQKLEIKYRAIIFNNYLCYLVASEYKQSDSDIIINETLYNEMLLANQTKNAEIRVIELEDESLSVKDFYDRKPSDLHIWNRKTQTFEISEEDQNSLQLNENIAFLSTETRRTNDAIELLDDAIEFDMTTDEEIAQRKELRKYRLLLSRVPTQAEYPLDPIWPPCPEFFKQ